MNVILAANPHLSARIERFRSAGARWHTGLPVLAENEGHVESVAVSFRRVVWTRQGPARIGGIGAVATLPEARGRGLAASVLAGCEKILAEEGYRTIVLFCTIVPFYERLGWRCASGQALPPISDSVHDPPAIRIAHLNLETDRPLLQEVYEKAGTGAIIRDVELWSDASVWLRENPRLLFGAFSNGDLVAYVRGRDCHDGLELLEATAIPSCESAIPLLVRAQMNTLDVNTMCSSPVTMMFKNIQHEVAVNTPGNSELNFDPRERLPWYPRIWWPADHF